MIKDLPKSPKKALFGNFVSCETSPKLSYKRVVNSSLCSNQSFSNENACSGDESSAKPKYYLSIPSTTFVKTKTCIISLQKLLDKITNRCSYWQNPKLHRIKGRGGYKKSGSL